jgi:CHAD domain-containing protein
MARARPVPGFAESASFREAAIRTVQVRTEEVFEHRDNVLDMSDIERVHDMRVATRRLRAAMEIFAPCFPKKQFRGLLREVKVLADALGARRDADVAIAGMERVVAELPVGDRAGVNHLLAELRAEQQDANDALAEMLSQIESNRLHERLLALAAEKGAASGAPAAEVPA